MIPVYSLTNIIRFVSAMKQIPTMAVLHSVNSLSNADLQAFDSVDEGVLEDYAVSLYSDEQYLRKFLELQPNGTYLCFAQGKLCGRTRCADDLYGGCLQECPGND